MLVSAAFHGFAYRSLNKKRNFFLQEAKPMDLRAQLLFVFQGHWWGSS